MRRKTNFARPLALCLAALLLLLLGACASEKGSSTDFGGFVVRTERVREDDTAEAVRAQPAAERTSPARSAEDYVLNMSSEKFHYPSCSAVGEISEKNRWDFHGTREEIIEMGYQPCKICNP